MQYIKPKRNVPEELVNENIRFSPVLVIGPEGEQLGTMSRREAIEKAYEMGLDLYCVAPNAQPSFKLSNNVAIAFSTASVA